MVDWRLKGARCEVGTGSRTAASVSSVLGVSREVGDDVLEWEERLESVPSFMWSSALKRRGVSERPPRLRVGRRSLSIVDDASWVVVV